MGWTGIVSGVSCSQVCNKAMAASNLKKHLGQQPSSISGGPQCTAPWVRPVCERRMSLTHSFGESAGRGQNYNVATKRCTVVLPPESKVGSFLPLSILQTGTRFDFLG